MPPKKRTTKGKGKSGDNSKKRKKRDSFSSSGDDFDSDSGAKGDGNHSVFKDNNGSNAHLDEDNGTDDVALQPKLPELSGRLLVCGGTNWDLIGRKELPKAAKNAAQTAPGIITITYASHLNPTFSHLFINVFLCHKCRHFCSQLPF
jgi:hypothetical protein